MSAGSLCGKDFTQDMRVFFRNGSEVLRRLVLRWLVLDCKEGDLRAACDSAVYSLDLWMLAGLFEVFEAAMLSSCQRHKLVRPSTEALGTKQEGKGSSSQTLSPSPAVGGPSMVCDPALAR